MLIVISGAPLTLLLFRIILNERSQQTQDIYIQCWLNVGPPFSRPIMTVSFSLGYGLLTLLSGCVSLPRSTTSSGWKLGLPIIVQFETKHLHISGRDNFVWILLISDFVFQAITPTLSLSFLYKYFANQYQIWLATGQNFVAFRYAILKKYLSWYLNTHFMPNIMNISDLIGK